MRRIVAKSTYCMILKYLQRKLGQKKSIFNLQLDLTYKCNLNCSHCYQRHGFKTGDEIGIDDWKAILRQYVKLTSMINTEAVVTISGGEPLTSPIFYDLLDHIKKIKDISRIYILTNGTVVNSTVAKALKESNSYVQISIEGSSADTNDNVRGRGSYRRAINGIAELRQIGVPFTLQTVLQQSTRAYIPNFFETAKHLGAQSMNFTRYIPAGIGNNFMDADSAAQVLSGSSLKNVFECILSASRQYAVPTNTLQPLWCLIDSSLGHPSSAGFLGLTINPFGDIQLTSRIAESLGSTLDKEGLLKVYFDSATMRKLRRGDIEGCSNCSYFRKCRGDRNISFITHGHFFGPDVHCWHWQEHIKDKVN